MTGVIGVIGVKGVIGAAVGENEPLLPQVALELKLDAELEEF